MVIFIGGDASPAQPPAFPARTCTSSGGVRGHTLSCSVQGASRGGQGGLHASCSHTLSSYQCHIVLEPASTICSYSIRAQGPAGGRTEEREGRRASSGTVKHLRRVNQRSNVFAYVIFANL